MARRFTRAGANGGWRAERPSRSWRTRTWPPQWGPAPIPTVGMAMDSVTIFPRSEGMCSSTRAEQPAFSIVSASRRMRSRSSSVRPVCLKDMAVWGSNPRCPTATIPAARIARTWSGTQPSSLTPSAPASASNRELARACSGVESAPKGRSTRTQAPGAPRRTATRWWSISFMPTWAVFPMPSMVLARESPTRITSTPAWTTIAAKVES